MKKRKIFLVTNLLMFFFYSSVMLRAQEKKVEQERIIYKYKEREKIDLGDLEIKGTVLAPGDISILERDRKKFRRPLYNREEFKSEIRQDILNLR